MKRKSILLFASGFLASIALIACVGLLSDGSAAAAKASPVKALDEREVYYRVKRVRRVRPPETALEVPEADLVERRGAIHVTPTTWLVPERKHRRRALGLELRDAYEVVVWQACIGIRHGDTRVHYFALQNVF